MPDTALKTVSATQVAALFNKSRYGTRWTLWNHFTGRVKDDRPEDSRMNWGKRLEPVVAEWFAEEHPELRMRTYQSRPYIRRGSVGYTGDRIAYHPEKGWGSVEIKCVFDWGALMRNWNGGENAPDDVELQVQTQMMVGTGRTPFRWSVIVVWCASQVYELWREPVDEVQSQIGTEAQLLLQQVAKGDEPSPTGIEIEVPALREAYPWDVDKVLDLRDDPAAWALTQMAADHESGKRRKALGEAVQKEMKAKLLGVMRGNGKLLLPGRTIVEAKKSKSGSLLFKVVQLDGWDKEVPPPEYGGEIFA